VAALAEGIPIFYGNAVKRIGYCPQGVAVTVKGDTVYKADACLCTVPLGVLKVRATVSLLAWAKGFSALRNLALSEVSSAARMYAGAVSAAGSRHDGATCLCPPAISQVDTGLSVGGTLG
jgi:hypothetical protein